MSIRPQDNADTLDAFQTGELDGAWVPEPWATRLVNEGGGKILVDEADLWPEGEFVTTHLIVSHRVPRRPPRRRQAASSTGSVAAIDSIDGQPGRRPDGRQRRHRRASPASRLPDELDRRRRSKNLDFTLDPIASSLQSSADDAERSGLLEPVDLDGIYDLTLLNEVLKAAERATRRRPKL